MAKKQPADDCPLPLGLSSLCEQGLSMYGHSGQVAISRWSKVWTNRNSSPSCPLPIDDWLLYKC